MPLDPVSGIVLNADNQPVNLVTLLGGGAPVSDKVYPPLDPVSGLILGPDNKAYDITSMLGGQMTVLPSPGAEYVGRIYQYAGDTTETLTHGHFYECIELADDYLWNEVPVGSGGGGASARVEGSTLIIT